MLLPQSEYPWSGASRVSGLLNSRRLSLAGSLCPQLCQAAPRNRAVGSKPGGGLHRGGEQAEPKLLGEPAVRLQPQLPPPTPPAAPCPTTCGQTLTSRKQLPDNQRATCNRITGGHSPPGPLLLHMQVSPGRVKKRPWPFHGSAPAAAQMPQRRAQGNTVCPFPVLPHSTQPRTGGSAPPEAPSSAPCASKLRASQRQPETFPGSGGTWALRGCCSDGGETPSQKS